MSDDIKIEHGIPLPTLGKRGEGKWEQLVKSMQVGDSFFLAHLASGAVTARLKPAVQHLKFKFTCRTVDGGVRVWRIA